VPKPSAGISSERAIVERYLYVAKAVGGTHKTITSVEIAVNYLSAQQRLDHLDVPRHSDLRVYLARFVE
jgi:hypothetical protein